MRQPAAVAGDQVTGTCIGHQIPSATGTTPVPPIAFSAPVTLGLATTVFIGKTLVALKDSSGPGVHVPADPAVPANQQMGKVVSGSMTVKVENRPMATGASSCSMCMGPATKLATTQTTVLVG
jgi:hypothetical protein